MFSTLLSLYLAAFIPFFHCLPQLWDKATNPCSGCPLPSALSLGRISQQEMTLELPTHNVGAQVDEEDGDGANGHWDAGNDVDEEGAELSNVLGQGVGNGFLQVVKDQAACGKRKYFCQREFNLVFSRKKINSNLTK